MTEKTFQTSVQYGGIALGLSIVLNIWVVMRHVEVYRDASRSEALLQQMVTRDQILQGVVQEFATRADTDPNIGAIFKKARAIAPPTAPANQTHP